MWLLILTHGCLAALGQNGLNKHFLLKKKNPDAITYEVPEGQEMESLSVDSMESAL